MSGIRVTPEQLASLSSRVSSGSASIEGELRSLTGSLAPLGSDWAGVAQQRFQALWAEWQKSAEGLRDALGGISQLLGQASTSYAEAERQIAASFGSLTRAGGGARAQRVTYCRPRRAVNVRAGRRRAGGRQHRRAASGFPDAALLA